MILIAFRARVTDWGALQRAWRDCLAQHRPKLAQRMALLRDGHDASRALILIEYPNAAAQEGSAGWHVPFAHCLDFEGAEEHVWELIEHGDQALPTKSAGCGP